MQKEHRLTCGVTFDPHSLTQPFSAKEVKTVPKDLANVLARPHDCPTVYPKKGSFYLGKGASSPSNNQRFPVWFPAHLLSSHVLIGGGIGSGKSTLLIRMIAGALKTYGTVIIGEAKGGRKGSSAGAAFTHLSQYLQRRIAGLQVYRWPRGHSWFNPLLYIKSPQERRAFLDVLCQQVQQNNQVDGDITTFLYNAGNITEQLLIFLQEYQSNRPLTLRSVLNYLKNPKLLWEDLQASTNTANEEQKQGLVDLKNRLSMLNFFYLNKAEFVGTRHGVNLLANMLDHEDLLWFSEPHSGLDELTLQKILYERSLVIVSQPLYDPASKVVGPLFWDSLLAQIIDLGPSPEDLDGKPRQKVLAVLDETHRLPVGRLGESGDFLREYDLGLVEITPAIVDEDRWRQNQHVYQTIISLSPGVPDISSLMQSRLPNFFLKPTVTTNISSSGDDTQTALNLRSDYRYRLSEDNPGVSLRTLQMSGRYTGLMQSYALDGKGQLFWLDFEDDLLANIKTLLMQATSNEEKDAVVVALDYALGLAEFPSS